MKTFNTLLTSLLLFILLTVGCSKFSNVYPNGDFKILILSDIHIKNSASRDTHLANMVKDINDKKYPGVEFVVTTGDNATSFYDNYYPDSLGKRYNRLGRFVEIMSKLNVPNYFAIGNHDYKIESNRDSDAPYNKGEIEKLNKMWTDITGFHPYYSFIHKEWKFIVLNSMSGRYMNRFFDEDQLKWLQKELKDEKHTLLFFHHPLTTDHFKIWGGPSGMITVNREPKFYAILERHKNKIKGIFVGHGHLWVNDKLFNKIKVYETASFGDDESSPYYVVGFDNKNYSISVARSPLEFTFTQN